MNERIKQLWRQAVLNNTKTPMNFQDAADGFAELIVQECIDIISPYTVRMSRPGEEYLHPIQEINKHFGVEE